MTLLTSMTIAEARNGLANKSFTARELTDAHLAAMEAARVLNAYILETPDRAREMAQVADEKIARGEGGPLAGMGTAFSASLFGLSGSLLLGYLELLAGQAQNRFFNELEEWLSERTRLTSSMAPGDGDAPIPVYIQALLEQTADNLENLQRIVGRGEESRMQANTQMTALLDRIGGLTDQLRAQAQLMVKLAESQAEMRPVIARLAEAIQGGRFGIDEQSRTHLRSLDSLEAQPLAGTEGALDSLTVNENTASPATTTNFHISGSNVQIRISPSDDYTGLNFNFGVVVQVVSKTVAA
jgi:hypothetical protein